MDTLFTSIKIIFHTLVQAGPLLIAPSFISTVFSGINYFIPSQNDFQVNHESLKKSLLKKRSDAVIKFVASVEFIPDSFMDVKDVQSEDLVLTLDKYAEYKYEIDNLKNSYYKNESWLRNSFFISMALIIIGLLHPYLGVVAFIFGVLIILFIFLRVRALSKITCRVHELKVCCDLIN